MSKRGDRPCPLAHLQPLMVSLSNHAPLPTLPACPLACLPVCPTLLRRNAAQPAPRGKLGLQILHYAGVLQVGRDKQPIAGRYVVLKERVHHHDHAVKVGLHTLVKGRLRFRRRDVGGVLHQALPSLFERIELLRRQLRLRLVYPGQEDVPVAADQP